MPRSVKTTRIIAEASIANGDVPSADGDMVTVAVTVPTRGYIHRAMLVWGKSSAFGGDSDDGGMYLHTTCAAGAGAGTTRLTSADAQTIFAHGIINPDFSDEGGSQLAIGSSVYVYAPAIDFSAGMKSTASGTGAIAAPGGGGPTGVYYDASGDTLGPTQGAGTIFATWIGGKDLNDDDIFCKLRLEIEPCP